ncbi:MAG: hypothetical protein J6A95_00850 [Clostridia bacterium]|nr:hypothetical protein [Clostridia bacterium]
MQELLTLSKWIQEKLDNAKDIYVEKVKASLKTDEPIKSVLFGNENVIYEFLIHTDIGNYKGYDYVENNTDQIVRYINAILTQTDSKVEGTGIKNITRNTTIEFLIPLQNTDIPSGNEATFINEIRNIIDTAFSSNVEDTYIEDGVEYAYGLNYSLSSTGNRMDRALVGDSVNLYAYVNFFMVEQGLNSSGIRLYIDGYEIVPLRIGISRGVTQSTDVLSDGNQIAKNNQTATLFTLNFDIPAMKSNIFQEMYNYALRGKGPSQNIGETTVFERPNVAHHVELSISGNYTTNKLMNFEAISINGQVPLIASLSVTMTEVFYIPGLTNLSPGAFDYVYYKKGSFD